MNSNRHVLLVTCPDDRGIIHKVTGVLLKHDLNIIENSEFVDRANATFFMRTEFQGKFGEKKLADEIRKVLPSGSTVILKPLVPSKIVVLVTKESHCIGDLLLRHSVGELNASILSVVSQYEILKELVEKFNIPFHHVPVDSLRSREQHEHELLNVIAPYKPDFLVLAKYMRILSPGFVSNFDQRIINIHHSFLPAFIGKNPYAQAFERGVKIIGATAHFVNENLDDGPIITQAVTHINHTQDALAISRAGRDVERTVLSKALNLVLDSRVIVQGRRTLIFE